MVCGGDCRCVVSIVVVEKVRSGGGEMWGDHGGEATGRGGCEIVGNIVFLWGRMCCSCLLVERVGGGLGVGGRPRSARSGRRTSLLCGWV